MFLTSKNLFVVLAALLLSVNLANASGGAPVIGGEPPPKVNAGHNWYFQPTTSDPENDKLTYSIRNMPSWATFWSGNGRLFGTPSEADVGWHGNIVIEVSDGTRTVALPSFSITVNSNAAPNTAPTISGTPKTAVGISKWYNFQPLAKDANGHSLSFSINNKPSWASFNTNTGSLYGRPGIADEGTNWGILIEVTDGKATAALPRFSIAVGSGGGGGGGGGGNNAPTISGDAPSRVFVGSPYWVSFDANDADGDPLTYSIQNKPPWATFWAGSGRLFGTPGSADIGIHGAITVEVSDGMSTTALPTFSIRVDGIAASNTAPTISGTPQGQINPGSWYSFVPTANDANDHALNYQIQNKPSWAKFDVNTGRLYGRPGLSDVGIYNNVRISVTDGVATRSLPVFSIAVGGVARSVTLSWTPPLQNTDGSTLTNLAGYRIYYGASAGNYPNRIAINYPGVSRYVVENLAPGTYYFVSTAVNASGVESAYSNVAIHNVN